VSWQGSGSQWRPAAVLPADVTGGVLVALGVLDDGELSPQPVSITNAVSVAVTAMRRRRAPSATRSGMLPPNRGTNL